MVSVQKKIYVKTAFLIRDLDEEIFMNCPKRLDGVTDKDALKLQKCFDGLV